MAKNSEFRAYVHIENELSALGWNTSNPAMRGDGEVYTQNECSNNSIIKQFLNKERPENVVIVRDNKFWVIEAKKSSKDIEIAIKEAKEYGDKLNKERVYAPLVSAVAGDGIEPFIIKSYYFYKGEWVEVEANGKKLTGLIPKDIARYFVDHDTYKTEQFQLPDELYYQKAKNINEILHLGSINKNYRARVISALLLAMLDDTPINLENSAYTLISEINARVETKLNEHNKRDFAPYINIKLPPSPDNHVKFRKALIDTIQELKSLNIRSAMNSGTDILGRFYEVFLKYGNGAKEIGIVLTPRHITKFAVEVANISYKDILFDPACGTGGFLVAGFDNVKRNSNEDQLNFFKTNGIYGIEQEPEVMALALVNMIFRGDGKNNIVEGNCFTKAIPKKATKVLMNPPFALKKDDEKEFKFIDRALEQMDDGGLLIAIIPSTIMFKSQNALKWRKNLLNNHTLAGVIKLPEDLFYPVAVHTSLVIIKKGTPHKNDANVYWGNLVDGYKKKKGTMRPTSGGNTELIQSSLIDFLNGSKILNKNSPYNYKISPILFDKELECAPEYYLEEPVHSKTDILSGMQSVFFSLISYQLNTPVTPVIDNYNSYETFNEKRKNINSNYLDKFLVINAKSNNIENYIEGSIPFVTSTELNNGVEKHIAPDSNSLVILKNSITVSSFGLATVQKPPYVARSHGAVIVLYPINDMPIKELAYYAAQINLQKWRFSYGRWVTESRLKKLVITDNLKAETLNEFDTNTLFSVRLSRIEDLLHL